MPRRSSRGRPAPHVAPRRASLRNPPQSGESRAPSPAPAQSGSGGTILGTIGATIAEGMAFGTGNAIAHRAVDNLLGPRTIQHKTVDPTVIAPAPTTNTGGSHPCIGHSKAFKECLQNNGSEIRRCQFYLDMLSECRRNSMN